MFGVETAGATIDWLGMPAQHRSASLTGRSFSRSSETML